ncbi:pilin N-terminal domain-containing protein [Vagococcus bubulae]|uniref:Gram-positive pilin subunit D1 N-terminal domain-containing protein n=1 Tax=Vagococcus bubulae TaxID=1977868 RepID=A0A429ZK55_9ENTE|nr:pilin N-terminal domain-containing protein [Vagococcus bubulae]RST94046.1 hypothetical protein CBF36_06615 [Vagococcus bubulae]
MNLNKKQVLWLVYLIGLFAFFPIQLYAEDGSYGIHIVKLGIREDTKLQNELIHNGLKLDEVKDEEGNILNGVSSIQYTVTRVTLKHSNLDATQNSSYEVVSGKEAFTKTVTTNQFGEADIVGLSKGIYQIKELPNDLLSNLMEPIIVSLPMDSKSGLLNDVYIYPKSSLVSKTFDSEPELPDKLPQTDGDIGQSNQLYWMIGLIGCMGMVGLLQFKKIKI